MPRRVNFTQTTIRGADRTERAYTITYLDDSPERHEAVSFFSAKAHDQKCAYRTLLPDTQLPKEVEAMSRDAAQAYLDSHPMQQQWALLKINHEDLIFDDDLSRLRYLPEIQSVTITSSRITDQGVRHLCHLTNLRRLVLYSRRVTSACLADVLRLQSLEALDLQMAPWVSRSAFSAVAARLPRLVDVYPPWRWPLTAIFRWFYAEWRIQRRQDKGLRAV
jgi:hypothetical protein